MLLSLSFVFYLLGWCLSVSFGWRYIYFFPFLLLLLRLFLFRVRWMKKKRKIPNNKTKKEKEEKKKSIYMNINIYIRSEHDKTCDLWFTMEKNREYEKGYHIWLPRRNAKNRFLSINVIILFFTLFIIDLLCSIICFFLFVYNGRAKKKYFLQILNRILSP